MVEYMPGSSVDGAGKSGRIAAAGATGSAGGGATGEAIGRAASSSTSGTGTSQSMEVANEVTIMHPEFAAIGAALVALIFIGIVARQE